LNDPKCSNANCGNWGQYWALTHTAINTVGGVGGDFKPPVHILSVQLMLTERRIKLLK